MQMTQSLARSKEDLIIQKSNLESLIDVYDSGNPYISFYMALEIYKIVTENNYFTHNRRGLSFYEHLNDYHSGNLIPEFHLCYAIVSGEPPRIEFYT
jgi:hypothetical protein